MPINFVHRVHTGFDKKHNKFVGLPLQWAGIVGANQILHTNRPIPMVDPSEITPTDIVDLKVLGLYHSKRRIYVRRIYSSHLIFSDYRTRRK